MNDISEVIKVQNVSKIYKLYDKPVDRLKESLNPLGKQYHKEFHAVKDVSFTIKKGETVGLVGKNGSGKSTLLKMITGVLTPSYGSVKTEGKISALLELGAGFNPEYTGIENIYLNGTIMGYSNEEIDAKLEDILSFADIGDFIYQPVKSYSSGMYVRLAFAVSINVDPDILIIDEALSVGDIRFQQKCFRKIEEFQSNKTILFVTHDMDAITTYCNRAIWIDSGELIRDGSPIELAKEYQAFMIGTHLSKYTSVSSSLRDEEDIEENAVNIDKIDENLDIHGDNKARIVGMSMYDLSTKEKVNLVTHDQLVEVAIKIRTFQTIENPIIGFTIKDRLGNKIVQTNTYVLEKKVSPLEKDRIAIYTFKFKIPHLNHGQYTISPAIASGTQYEHIQHSWVHDALVFNVLNKQKYSLEGFLVLNEIDFHQKS